MCSLFDLLIIRCIVKIATAAQVLMGWVICHLCRDLPVDSVISDDLFTVKRTHDVADARDTATHADDVTRKVC